MLFNTTTAADKRADFATALTKLLSAKALLIAKPDSKTRHTELTYTRATAIDGLIDDVRKQQNAAKAGSQGIQSTNIKYVSTSDTP